jgi:hypothetical protein
LIVAAARSPDKYTDRRAAMSLLDLRVGNNDPVGADHMLAALTAGALVFGDGARQVFTRDGHTTYTDHGRPSEGRWSVIGDGRFESFWPPSYTARYDVRWLVEDDAISGLTFTDTVNGARFVGHYL